MANLTTALKGAKGFIKRLRIDSRFKQKVESLSSHAELMIFARQEGFIFTSEELKEALKFGPDDGLAKYREVKIPRRAQRYKIYLKISEVNGQPVTDAMILDFNAWGARIGSFSRLDTQETIDITFIPPGETNNVCIASQVRWSRLMPNSQYHTGVEFSRPIDQLYREGKL